MKGTQRAEGTIPLDFISEQGVGSENVCGRWLPDVRWIKLILDVPFFSATGQAIVDFIAHDHLGHLNDSP